MSQTPDEDKPATGLRERKKARTKTAIQQHALRLFREQGYQGTTVEQVAAAAEVAPSTVFRYFPTKEDLAALDDYYSFAPAIAQAFESQPPELSPVQAFRATLREVFANLSPEERAARYERDLLMLTVPELWAANLGLLTSGQRLLSEVVAKRIDRGQDDTAVRAITGAVMGVGLATLFDWANHPDMDPAAALDDALAQLDAGLPS